MEISPLAVSKNPFIHEMKRVKNGSSSAFSPLPSAGMIRIRSVKG
ncbi:hypothetical protein MUS_1681 [Bacillus velezensis YAU B9601-Y2]|uniref:Uncharacterized protein n=1 Tax=Bacillus amyloliquefaciens (strain Y2) TaxID=1155777 RepID=I2C4V7_BACAY|nr:hypothetical protein MUS_1681 [Bacillus velezensis YAU B9601-Y2]